MSRDTRGRLKGSVSAGEVEQVRQIEAERKAKGYAFGWTYHRAAERRLILAYEHTLGAYKDPGKRDQYPKRGRSLRDADPLLTVELVPGTCVLKSVRQSVVKESGEQSWNSIREDVAGRADSRCEVCLGKGRKYPVGCHGVFEYDDYARTQTLTGFICLCPGCAEVRHIGLASPNGRYEIAFKRLMMVNRWTADEAGAYMERVEAVHERRREVSWEQDMSLAFRWTESASEKEVEA